MPKMISIHNTWRWFAEFISKDKNLCESLCHDLMPTTICSQNFVVRIRSDQQGCVCIQTQWVSLLWLETFGYFLFCLFSHCLRFFRTNIYTSRISHKTMFEGITKFVCWSEKVKCCSSAFFTHNSFGRSNEHPPKIISAVFLCSLRELHVTFVFGFLASLEQRCEQTPTACWPRLKTKFIVVWKVNLLHRTKPDSTANQYISENYVFFGRPW